MSKLKKALVFILVLLLVAALAFGAILIIKPSIRLIIKDFLTPPVEFELPTDNALVLKDLTLDELLNERNVYFSQALMLVNTENLLKSDFLPDIAEYKDSGVTMNVCIMSAYERLAADVRVKFDQKLYISSAYRTAEKQDELHNDNPVIATKVGASEHQTGLALDVYVSQYAGAGFLNSKAGQFVNDNCQDYGFIIRYPSFGEDITGIPFEPWHIRYVGAPHAQIIAENRITLEEYIGYIETEKYYRYGDYIIARFENEEFSIPTVYESVYISPDNMGGYILTVKVSK